MRDRLTRIQLSIFAVVTVLTVTAISAFYLHVPAKLGIGTYNVSAEFVAGGGLYRLDTCLYRLGGTDADARTSAARVARPSAASAAD